MATLGRFLAELRVAARSLGRRPVLAAVGILTVALGIGANAAVFSVVNAVILEALPFPESDRLVVASSVNTEQNDDWPSSYLDIQDWRARSSSFDGLTPYTGARSFNLVAEGESKRITGELVESVYFKILGTRPVVGRLLSPEEDSPGLVRNVVLSHHLWVRQFGSDPAVVGQSLVLDGVTYEIVGVAESGFSGLSDEADVWLPITLAGDLYGAFYLEARPLRWLSALGRLRSDVGIEEARDDLARVAAGLAEEYPDVNGDISTSVHLLEEKLLGQLSGGLLLLSGAAAFVLLLACVNLANLLLVRTAARDRELAMRRALGARTRDLLRVLLTEGVLLALAGLVLGLALAQATAGALVRLAAVDIPSFVHVAVDPRVVGVMAAAAVATGGLGAVAPLSAVARGAVNEKLGMGGRSTAVGFGGGKLQSTMGLVEVAVALVLLVGAGLLAEGFRALASTPLGFRAEDVFTVRMDVKEARFAADEAYWSFAEAVLEEIRATEGVHAAAAVGPAMPTDDWNAIHLSVEDRILAGDAQPEPHLYHLVSPDFFRTLGVPVLQGRDFNANDRGAGASPPVSIVSREMAQHHWPGENPIGKRLKFGPPTSGSPWFEVIGVVEDVRHAGPTREQPGHPDVYFSLFQLPARIPPVFNLMVRSEIPQPTLLSRIQSIVERAAPGLPVFDPRSLASRVAEQTAHQRFLVILARLFASLAIVLSAVGIYGIFSHAVSRQRREFGIRMALGGTGLTLVGLVLRRALSLAAVGVVAGVLGALAFGRALEHLLHGVSPAHLQVYVTAAFGVFAVVLAACCIPAVRAARTNPAVSLRVE